jgi:hypothetical protein
MAVTANSAVFWDVTPCSPLDRSSMTFWGNILPPSLVSKSEQMCLHFAGCLLSLLFDLEDRGNTFLQNISKLLPDYTVSYPKKNPYCSTEQAFNKQRIFVC